MADQDLIREFLEKRRPAVVRAAFADGCEIPTHERRLIRRDRKASC